MSYEPTTWKDGDLVTSAKLNKMEQGIANGGGILVVHQDENNRLDKTWQEIYDAELAVLCGIENNLKNTLLISGVGADDNEYHIWVQTTMGQLIFIASTPDDYPVYNEETGGGTK